MKRGKLLIVVNQNPFEEYIMSTKTEPTVGTLSGLFGKKPAVRNVSTILGGFTALVDELKGAVAHHQSKIVESSKKIEALQEEISASGDEIATANNAIDNITALIGQK
jgi:outer membrane murein-binding lipoprotein Lpp